MRFGRVAEIAAGGLLLSGVLWCFQNPVAAVSLADGALRGLGLVGVAWGGVLWFATCTLLIAGLLAYAVHHWEPDWGIGDLPPFFTVAGGLGRFLIEAAVITGLVAGSLGLSMAGSWLGLVLLVAAAGAGAWAFFRLGRLWRRFWNPLLR